MKLLPPPGPERRSQLTRLGVLGVLLLAVLWFWRAPAGTPPAASDTVVARADTNALPVPEAVELRRLESVPPLDAASRNPFTFGVRQAPAPSSGNEFLLPPQPLPPPVFTPPVPQGPPPIALTLTGMSVVTEGGRTMVTLKDPGTNALYQAFEGDIVDGRYRVVKVGLQSVVVSYVDGSGSRTLSLGG